MNLGLIYYFVIVLSKVYEFTGFLAIFFTFTSIISLTFSITTRFMNNLKENELKLLDKVTKYLIITSVFALFISTIIPSKKDMLIISGLNIANSPLKKTASELEETFPDLVKLLNKEIKKELGDLKKEVGRDE